MKQQINIDQENTIKWRLTLREAIVFSYLHDNVQGTGRTAQYARSYLIEQLPIVTDKSDTMYRILRSLDDKGLIFHKKSDKWDSVTLLSKSYPWSTHRPHKSRLNLTELNEFNNLREQLANSLVIDEWMMKDVIEGITIKFK